MLLQADSGQQLQLVNWLAALRAPILKAESSSMKNTKWQGCSSCTVSWTKWGLKKFKAICYSQLFSFSGTIPSRVQNKVPEMLKGEKSTTGARTPGTRNFEKELEQTWGLLSKEWRWQKAENPGGVFDLELARLPAAWLQYIQHQICSNRAKANSAWQAAHRGLIATHWEPLVARTYPSPSLICSCKISASALREKEVKTQSDSGYTQQSMKKWWQKAGEGSYACISSYCKSPCSNRPLEVRTKEVNLCDCYSLRVRSQNCCCWHIQSILWFLPLDASVHHKLEIKSSWMLYDYIPVMHLRRLSCNTNLLTLQSDLHYRLGPRATQSSPTQQCLTWSSSGCSTVQCGTPAFLCCSNPAGISLSSRDATSNPCMTPLQEIQSLLQMKSFMRGVFKSWAS